MSNTEVVICSPVRTAIGTYGGTLKDMPAADVGAVAIRATLERAKLTGGDIDTVVMGNVIQAGNKMNPARQAAIQRRRASQCSCSDGKSRMWFRSASDCQRSAGDHARLR